MTKGIVERFQRNWRILSCSFLLLGVTLPAQEGSEAKTNAVVGTAVRSTNYTVENPTGVVSNAPAEDVAEAENPRTGGKWSFRNSFDDTLSGNHRNAVVLFGKSVVLNSNQTAEAVVVIGGSATVRGTVRNAVVAIGGNVNIDGGEVGDAVVAVMGSVKVGHASIVHGDVVAVGGETDVADGAKVEGQIQPVEIPGFNVPKLEWFKNWLKYCVFELRPLAPQVGWVWAVTGAFFLLYILITVAFPRPVTVCVNDLTQRPATTFLMGLLIKLLAPLVLLILVATGIGLVVVPFVLVALWLGALLGKAALLQYIGKQLSGQFRSGALHRPLLAFLIGWILVTVLYMVPILGLLTMMLTSMWGLGVAVMAMFGGLRREMPDRPAASPTPPPPVVSAPPDGLAPMQAAGTPPFSDVTGAATVSSIQSTIPPITGAFTGSASSTLRAPINPPVIGSEALLFPRAGFWERMAAAFLDVVLAGILIAIVGGSFGHYVGPWIGYPIALAYFAGLWAWKGTTVGGIVLNLKVVRLDGQPVTFVVALVRGLAAAFSAVVLFLGFLWIAWDRDKQGWHDKIAGTTVIRLPRGTPLVCL